MFVLQKNQGLHTEMLMTGSTEDLLLENFWLVAAGFGAGLQAAWGSLKIKTSVASPK